MRKSFVVLACLALVALLQFPCHAARDYAYIFLQGKLIDTSTGRPVARASVRLTTSERTFEVLSDERGIFAFEKLPIEAYELRIATPDGKVIRGIERSDPNDPQSMRFALRLGKGYGAGVRIEATREQVTVDVPEKPTNWPRLWKQTAIFVGGAAALVVF